MLKKILNYITGKKEYKLEDILKEYGVTSLDELRKTQLPKKAESVILLLSNILNPDTITEIAILASETYTIERDKELRNEIEHMNFKYSANSNFDLSKDLLMMYQICTTNNKTFIATIVEPFDPYLQTNLLWFYESPIKFEVMNINDNIILYKNE